MKILKMRYLTGYADPDTVLIHSSFEVLSQYVEKEMDIVYWWPDNKETRKEIKAGHITKEEVQKLRKVKKDIMELYEYWKEINEENYEEKNDPIFSEDVPILTMEEGKTEYPLKTIPILMICGDGSKKDKRAYEKASKASNKWNDKFHERQENMLIKLIKIRRYLWS